MLNFRRFATQGGGTACLTVGGVYVFVEDPPEGFDIGQAVPREWDMVEVEESDVPGPGCSYAEFVSLEVATIQSWHGNCRYGWGLACSASGRMVYVNTTAKIWSVHLQNRKWLEVPEDEQGRIEIGTKIKCRVGKKRPDKPYPPVIGWLTWAQSVLFHSHWRQQQRDDADRHHEQQKQADQQRQLRCLLAQVRQNPEAMLASVRNDVLRSK